MKNHSLFAEPTPVVKGVVFVIVIVFGLLTFGATTWAKTWSREIIESAGDKGGYTSIVLDNNGLAHIAYRDETSGDLKYAYQNGDDTWSTQILDSGGDVGTDIGIAYDEDNDIYAISYFDATNSSLKYASNEDGDWQVTTIDNDAEVGGFSSIAIDENRGVHIGYFDATDDSLKYMYRPYGGGWLKVVVEDAIFTTGYYIDIAVDDNTNQPRMSYIDVSSGYVKLASHSGDLTGGVWTLEAIDDSGTIQLGTSIAIDCDSNVHVSYHDNDSEKLKYAKKTGTNWSLETVRDDTGSYGMNNSIALDGNGNPRIAYYEFNSGLLLYSYKSGSTWYHEVADGNTEVGSANSLAIDENGNAHISYYDEGDGDLKYAFGYTALSGTGITIKGGNTYTTSTSVALRNSGSGIYRMRFSNDGSHWTGWKVYSSTYNWNLANSSYGGNSNSGTKRVYAQYKDVAGTTSSKSDTIIYDHTPPSGFIRINKGDQYTGTKRIKVSVYSSGTHLMRFSSDSKHWSAWIPYQSKASWNLVTSAYGGNAKSGKKYVYAQLKDSAGNISNKKYDSIIYDRAPPKGSLTIENADQTNHSSYVNLLPSSTDSLSGVVLMRFSNNGVSWTGWKVYRTLYPKWQLTSTSYGGNSNNGTKYVYAQYRDAMGNVSGIKYDGIYYKR